MRTRPYRIAVWLNDEQKTKLKKMAAGSGRSASDILRAMIDGYQLREMPSEELHELNRQLLRIGVNLNQIANKANSFGLLDAPFYEQQARQLQELRLALINKFLIPEKKEEA